MKTVFVTAVGGDIGYGVVKALRASDNALRIIGCDIKEYNASRDLVDAFYLSPPYDDPLKWLTFIRRVLAEEACDYFWPVTEPEIRILMDMREPLTGGSVVMNTREVLDVALDKKHTADFLAAQGIGTPLTLLPGDDMTLRFPCVVKERQGYGSHGVTVAGDESALSEALARMHNPLIQESVGTPEEEYSLTVFSDGRVTNHIAFRRELGFGGMSRYVELVRDEAFAQIALRVADALHLRGSVNVQLRRQDGDYYVFEINPRISSTIGFRMQLGFNDVAWWIDLMEGKEVAPYTAPNGRIHGARIVDEKLFYD